MLQRYKGESVSDIDIITDRILSNSDFSDTIDALRRIKQDVENWINNNKGTIKNG